MSRRISNLLFRLLTPRRGAGRKQSRPTPQRLGVEQLEDRTLLSGTWQQLAHNAPSGVGTMMLLSDGTVMAQQGGTTKSWYKLAPQALTGDYIQGTWSSRASMSLERLYYASNVLPSGKVLVVAASTPAPQVRRTIPTKLICTTPSPTPGRMPAPPRPSRTSPSPASATTPRRCSRTGAC